MRDFFRWLDLCRKMAGRHFQLIIDLPLYAVSFGLPFLAWLHPAYWNSTGGQTRMNGLYWAIPSTMAAFALMARLALSPYWVFQEEKNKGELFSKQLADLSARSILVKFNKPIESGLLSIRVINHGKNRERVNSVRLGLSDGKYRFEKFDRIHKFLPDISCPHIFDSGARFDVEFFVSYGTFVSYGVRFFRAIIELDDETVIESDIQEVDASLQDAIGAEPSVPFLHGLTIQEGWMRQERIANFVSRYSQLHQSSMRFKQNLDLINFQNAEVLALNDSEEVRDACKMLERKEISHPFKEQDFSKDVLAFFCLARDNNVNLRSVQGGAEYSAYFDGLLLEDTP